MARTATGGDQDDQRRGRPMPDRTHWQGSIPWRCGGYIVRAGKGNRGVSDRQILRVLFSGDLLASAYQNPNGRELSCNLSCQRRSKSRPLRRS